MKISYNWLKNYLNFDLSPEETSGILTDTGLEVEGIGNYQSVKGGLEGVVIGKVLTCEKHPNADRLTITTVDVGEKEPLKIVCGAPNVEKGQTVPVAKVGTTLYPSEKGFTIKKSKIRGEVSEGMICAEDELGLGASHEGIMVLDDSLKIGSPAKDHFPIYEDTIFEIGLTPNRTDAISHLGTARDLAAALSQKLQVKHKIEKPSVEAFKPDNNNLPVEIIVEDERACPRYTGVTIENLTVKESPKWLKDKLNAIGVRPINNIVDITNYVMHETGQPLHAFDMKEIKDNKVIVKKLPEDTKFTTLDEIERKLTENDLMICNSEGGMCIAGVFGGINSGVTEKSTSIFIESAYFDPVHIRKTAKHHGLNTDASFRFERGADPNITVYAAKRAALLIKEIAGGEISSGIIDVYPQPIPGFEVILRYRKLNTIIGKTIPQDTIKSILENLEIKVIKEDEDYLTLNVPPYRADVNREVDVMEEILRIYGYNNVEAPQGIRTAPVLSAKPDKEKIKNTVFDHLSANGFYEIMSNSLTKAEYYTDNPVYPAKNLVPIVNPLSKELNAMRQTLLYSGLEAIIYNKNRQAENLKFYEFGKVYSINPSKPKNINVTERFTEKEQLAFFTTGRLNPESWHSDDAKTDFYALKNLMFNVAHLCSVDKNQLKLKEIPGAIFSKGLEILKDKKKIGEMGILQKSLLKKFDIEDDVYYGYWEFEALIESVKVHQLQFKPVPKFPEVRRDLALLIDKNIQYSQIESIAYETGKKLLKNVNLFDIYEGKNIPQGKKSYAISLHLLDENKTLTEKEIDKLMNKLIKVYKQKINAEIR